MNRLVFASLISLAACGGTGVDGSATGAQTGEHTGSSSSTSSNAGGTGAAPSSSYAPSLVTLSGLIDSSTLPKLPPKIRVAVVWPVSGNDHEAEGVDVSLTQLPTRYILDLSSLPPTDVMQSAASNSAAAGVDLSGVSGGAGTIIAYVDADGNGKRASDGSEPVIAMSGLLYFVQGNVPAAGITASNGATETGLVTGFNMVQYAPPSFDQTLQMTDPSTSTTTPLANDINLELGPTSAPSGSLLCATGFDIFATPGVDHSPPEQTNALPPAGATFFCSTDGEIVFWNDCSGTLCDESCPSSSLVLDGSKPVPANWPCPLNQQ